MAWWNPFKPTPQPSPGAGDSSSIESGGDSSSGGSNGGTYQGPQQPGYGFTPGGGSAPISGGNTVGGGSSGGSSGGGGGSSGGGSSSGGGGSSSGGSSDGSNVPQIGSMTITESEAKQMIADNQKGNIVQRATNYALTPLNIQAYNIAKDSYYGGINKNVQGGVTIVKDYGSASDFAIEPTGGTLGSGSSVNKAYSSYTEKITPSQIKQVETVINQEKLKAQQQRLELQRDSLKMLGIEEKGAFTTQALIDRIEQQKMSYMAPDLTKVNIEDIINKSRTNILGQKVDGYISPEVANTIISLGNNQRMFQYEQEQTALSKQAELNNIKNEVYNYSQNLQNKINNEELNIEDAQNMLNAYIENKNAELNKTYENIDKEWFDKNAKRFTNIDKDILANVSALRIRDKINIPNILKATATGVAIGATAGVGLGLLGGTATVAGASVATGLGIVGGGALAYDVGATGLNLYKGYKSGELSLKEIGAELEFKGVMLASTTAGAYAGGLIGTQVGTSIKTNIANRKANEFVTKLNKEIKTNRALQDKYWTNENLNRGYALETINGVEYKLPLNKNAILRYKEFISNNGLPKASKFESMGVLKQEALKNELIINLDKQNFLREIGLDYNNIKGAEIGKIKFDMYGKNVDYNVIGITRPDGSKLYFTFKASSTGKITNIKVLDFIKDGEKIYANLYAPTKARVTTFNTKSQAGKLEIFETGSLKYQDTYLFNTKGRVIDQQIVGDKTIQLVEVQGKVYTIESKVGGTTVRKLITKIDSPELQSFKLGTREEVARVLGRQLNVAKDNLIFSKTQSNILDMSYLKNLPNRNVEGLEFSKIFSKKMKILNEPTEFITRIPKEKPAHFNLFETPTKQEYPSIVEMGGKGESLYTFNPRFDLKTNLITNQEYGLFVSQTIKPTLSVPKIGLNSITTPNTQALFMPLTNLDTGLKLKTKYENPIIFEGTKLKSIFETPVLVDRVKTGNLFKTGIISSVRQDTKIKPVQIQIPAIIQKPILKPIIPLPLKPIKEQPFVPKPFIDPFFGLPHLGEVQTGGGQRSRPTSVGLFGKTKYNPSLGSVLLRAPKKKVTQAEYERLSQQKFSGLGLRPELEIISGKKKKRLSLF